MTSVGFAPAQAEARPQSAYSSPHNPLGPSRSQADRHGWTSEVHVDRSQPFFFDHPLDHIPGMLLFCSLAETARRDARTEWSRRLRASLTFRAIAELDPAPQLCAGARQGGRRDVRITQDSQLVADGWFEIGEDDGPRRLGPGPEYRRLPAQASLVHRMRPENVMIGEPVLTDDQVSAEVVTAPPGHVLCGTHADTRPVEAVVEAGRQLSTWLPHRVGNWPLETQMLWVGVDVDLPLALPRSLPVALRWSTAPIPAAGRATFALEVVAGANHESVLGSLVYASKPLRPEVYARFRAGATARRRTAPPAGTAGTAADPGSSGDGSAGGSAVSSAAGGSAAGRAADSDRGAA